MWNIFVCCLLDAVYIVLLVYMYKVNNKRETNKVMKIGKIVLRRIRIQNNKSDYRGVSSICASVKQLKLWPP